MSRAAEGFERPIHVPGSPFWTVFRRFGRDELLALIVSVVGTAIVSVFVASPLVLSLVGPLIEKIGFFPAHFKEAWDVYRTTQKEKRKRLRYYVRRAFGGSMTSLVEDVLVHDPLYIAGVYLGLLAYPSVPVWMLSAVSFVVAVVIVAFLEVAYVELRYVMFKRRLRGLGFDSQSYIESRFIVSTSVAPQGVMERMAKEFALERVPVLEYSDWYVGSSLPFFGGRVPKVRVRKRTSEVKENYLPSVQVTYTRPSEHSSGVDQYRFFPIRKDKFYFVLDQPCPASVGEIRDARVRRFLMRAEEKSESREVQFNRFVARDSELFVSADVFMDDREYYVLELKVHRDVLRLVAAMRFVMREFPVRQTTFSKSEV